MAIYGISQIFTKLHERNNLMEFMFSNAVCLIGDRHFPEAFNEFTDELSIEKLRKSCYLQQYLKFLMCFLQTLRVAV